MGIEPARRRRIVARARTATGIAAAAAALCLTACGDRGTVTRLPSVPVGQATVVPALYQSNEEDLNPRLLRRFKPLALQTKVGRPEWVNLGRMLYFEPLMSRDRTVSCNTCHPLDRYGTTATAVSTGINGQHGVRNAPSTYNAAGHFRQFWDGRAENTRVQVRGPLENPTEMGMDEPTLVKRLSGIEGYQRAFAGAFPSSGPPVTLEHVSDAIAEFEWGLLTPARWDRYLQGDTAVLTPQEKAGAKLFANLGCMVCHEGQFLGGSMFQRAGAVIPWPNQKDRGRRGVTHDAADDMMFKVPSLRNVVKTAPYFHDGSVATLEEAVQMMARHQLGVSLTQGETDSIVTWMGSLTGTIPADYVRAPQLPAADRP